MFKVWFQIHIWKMCKFHKSYLILLILSANNATRNVTMLRNCNTKENTKVYIVRIVITVLGQWAPKTLKIGFKFLGELKGWNWMMMRQWFLKKNAVFKTTSRNTMSSMLKLIFLRSTPVLQLVPAPVRLEDKNPWLHAVASTVLYCINRLGLNKN